MRAVHGWADAAERLTREKYGVVPTHYHKSIYLEPAPTAEANVDNALNRCCRSVGGTDSAGTHLYAVTVESSDAERHGGPDQERKETHWTTWPYDDAAHLHPESHHRPIPAARTTHCATPRSRMLDQPAPTLTPR